MNLFEFNALINHYNYGCTLRNRDILLLILDKFVNINRLHACPFFYRNCFLQSFEVELQRIKFNPLHVLKIFRIAHCSHQETWITAFLSLANQAKKSYQENCDDPEMKNKSLQAFKNMRDLEKCNQKLVELSLFKEATDITKVPWNFIDTPTKKSRYLKSFIELFIKRKLRGLKLSSIARLFLNMLKKTFYCNPWKISLKINHLFQIFCSYIRN